MKGATAGASGSKVNADIKRNRLYITLSSNPSKDVLAKVYSDVRFCVADLSAGFDVITDLSQCSIGHLNGISVLRKIMNYLIAKQVGQVVRILGKKSLVFKQIVRFSSIFKDYSVCYVNTLEAAEDMLAKSARRGGIRFRLHGHQIEYGLNDKRGQGQVIDISLSGCAVQGATVPLAPAMQIFVSIKFDQGQDNPVMLFSITAKVVRAKDDTFAVQFLDLDDNQKKVLYKCLADKIRQENP